jgi:sortase (surface protein transpeptidase)
MSSRTQQISALWGVVLLAAAVAILVALSTFGWLPLPAGGAQSAPAASTSTVESGPQSASAVPTPPSTPPSTRERSPSPAEGAPASDQALPEVERVGIVPDVVSIPDLSVQALVTTVGLDAGGGVVVPEDVSTVGWYSGSVPIGSQVGSSVLVGHRDSKVQGIGALGAIENLTVGERIVVAGAGDLGVEYEVQEVAFVEKSNFVSIVADAFGIDGPHRLTLITCGGDFDAQAGSYLSNVIVTATPVTPDTA